jgi:hypothetical protein
VVVRGYLGHALKRPPLGQTVPSSETALEPPQATEIYWRLYLRADLSEYIEFRDDDVLCYFAVQSTDKPLRSSMIWLKVGARIDHIRVNNLEVQAGFLQGAIAERGRRHSSGPGASMGGGEGAATFGGCGGATFSADCMGATFSADCGGATFSADCMV